MTISYYNKGNEKEICYYGKAFEELQIKDDFMFNVIMRNPKFCKLFLERVLGIKISRLDIYVEDGNNTVYNIEMQTTENRKLPKRTRYYQGMIDLNILEKGENYKELKRGFVIFVCTFGFIDGKEPEDEFTRELDEAVQSVRKNEKWRLDYMTLQMN